MSLREVVAKAEWESATDTRWEDVSPAVAERAMQRADAALTAALSWLAAEAADSKFPGYIYWADSGGGCSLADYLRSQIPPGQEGERDV